MRALVMFVLVSSAALVACGKSDTPAPAGNTAPGATAAAPTSNGPAVTGMVLADKPAALDPSSALTVRLLDVTNVQTEPTLVAEQKIAITAIPAEFSIPYDSANVNPIRSYAVEASVMSEGQVRYVSAQRQGVLTQGKPARANVTLVEALAHVEKDPAAELNREFTQFESMLGGLKRFQDSRIVGPEGKQVAIGWDGFADDTGVRMVRQQIVDDAAGTRVSERFAYKDGKPWIAIREAGGTTTKLGWSADGTLVVKERNGKADEAAASLADELSKSAKEAYDIAAAKVPG